MSRSFIFIIFSLFIVSSCLAISQEFFEQSFYVTIRLENDIHESSKDLIVHYNLTSTHIEDLDILSWKTPMEGIEHDMFHIVNTQSQEQPTYMGILKNMVEPTNKHLDLVIEAEGSIAGSVNIGQYYRFDNDGLYEIQLSFHVVGKDGNRIEVVSNKVTFSVVDSLINPVVQPVYPGPSEKAMKEARSVSYIPGIVPMPYCFEYQRIINNDAINNAKIYTEFVVKAMEKGCTSEFITWFGEYSSKRYKRVQTNFENCYDYFLTLDFNISCDCKISNSQDVYAYVQPTDPSVITVCSAYFHSSEAFGETDTTFGTLLHEATHFFLNAGTADIAYGQYSCQELAKTNPDAAAFNADSHQYFLESDPSC